MQVRLEDRQLAFEAQHRGGDQRSAREHTGIRQQEARGEIVGAVADNVIVLDQVEHIVGVETRAVRLELHLRVDGVRRPGSRCDLRLADPVSGVGDLALQVRQLDLIVIDDPDRANAGRRQIQRQRRAQPAGTDHQHPRRLQLRLAGAAYVLQQNVPRVAADFVFGEIEVHGAKIWRYAAR